MDNFLKYLRDNYPELELGERFAKDIEARRQRNGPLLDFTFEHHKGNEYIVRLNHQYEPVYFGSTFTVYLTGNKLELPDYSAYPYRE